MFDQELKAIREILGPLTASAYIAGGAAIAPHTAGDIDVWVLGDQLETLQQRVEQNAWLHAQGGAHGVTLFRNANCEGLTAKECADYKAWLAAQTREATGNSMADHGIKLVATVTMRASYQKVQFLSVAHDDIHKLLNHFDISTHRWAISLLGGHLEAGQGATLPSQEPQVLSTATPELTMRRLAKISQRYGWDYRKNLGVVALQKAASLRGELFAFDAALKHPFEDVTVPF